MLKVQESEQKDERFQVHYLSVNSQNEFISVCDDLVRKHILKERMSPKYFLHNSRCNSRWHTCGTNDIYFTLFVNG